VLQKSEDGQWPATELKTDSKISTLFDESDRDAQLTRYAHYPVTLQHLRQVVEVHGSQYFHWTDLREAEKLRAMFGQTQIAQTVFAVASTPEESNISVANALVLTLIEY